MAILQTPETLSGQRLVYLSRDPILEASMQELIQVDKKEAKEVLLEVDTLLQTAEQAVEQAGSCFIDLSFLLLKVKRGAYWTERGYHSEQEYIDKVFPQSRAQYYTFIRFGTHLSGYARPLLKKWGRSKCEDLVRLHVHFKGEIPEQWFQALDEDNKDTFRRRVRAYLDALEDKEKKAVPERSGEPSDKPETEDTFITFKIFGNAIHTVNMALDTMKKIMGTDKSLGYLLENICANFNSQFAEDNTGHVMGKNAYILGTIEGLIQQLDFKVADTSEMLIGIVAKGVEKNVAT